MGIGIKMLARPFVLVTIEEQKVCEGHKEKSGIYKGREKTKDQGYQWVKQESDNPNTFHARFDILHVKRRKYELLKFFEHMCDVSSCDHYKITTVTSFLIGDPKRV